MNAGSGGPRPSFALVLVVALALATGMNLAQFRSLEDSGSVSVAQPVDARDLLTVVDEHSWTTRLRFLLYLQLGEVAEGGRLHAYRDSGLERDALLGLARLDEVEIDGYEPVIPDDLARDLVGRAAYRGDHRAVGEYAIVVPETPGRAVEIITVTDGTVTLLVDRSLLPAGMVNRG